MARTTDELKWRQRITPGYAHQRTLWVHLGVVGAIMMLGLGIALTGLKAASDAETNAALVERSGQQQVLGLQILSFAQALVLSPVPGAETALSHAVDEFDDGHRALSTQANATGALSRIYFESGTLSIQAMSRRFLELARTILENPRSARQNDLRDLANLATPLLAQQSEATIAFAAMSGQRSFRSANMQVFLAVGIAGLLLAHGVFVIWPARRAIDEARKSRRRANTAALDAQSKADAATTRSRDLVSRLAHAEGHDILTGLMNRSRLEDQLDRCLIGPHMEGLRLGIACLDIDHFRALNESRGHKTGNAILKSVAERIRKNAPPQSLCARTDGNGFVVAGWIGEADGVENIVAALKQSLAEPIVIAGKSHRIGVSAGMAMAATDTTSGARLVSDAEIALARVKAENRGQARHFEARMRSEFEGREQTLSDLRNAIQNEEFRAFLQPQISLKDSELQGFELLARWQHPERGLLAPEDFLEIASEAGLADEIDQLVLCDGLDCFRSMLKSGQPVARMSINASAKSLQSDGFADILKHRLDACDLAPEHLTVEVSETRFAGADRATTVQALERLNWAGFRVELDDFGTGTAAMSTLSMLPIAGVKLDRALVRTLPDEGSESVIRAMIGLASDLGLAVTAQGVETPAQSDILKSLGCDCAQGFAIGRPLSASDAHAWVQAHGAALTSASA